MKVSVSNQQDSVPVALKKLRADVLLLSSELFANLRGKPPGRYERRHLRLLEERGQLNLTLVSNQKIRALNRQWRRIDKATDVLSFSLLEDDDTSLLLGQFTTMPIDLGDVVISMQRARQQALAYGHSLEREVAFLFVHGFLHLLGFDHMNESDEKEMFGRQEQILRKAGFRRA